MRVAVNGRFELQPPSGVQRYAGEIGRRLSGRLRVVSPAPWAAEGAWGHAWEQLGLRWHLHGDLLWSPGNTGPLGTRHQVLTIHDLATLDHPEWFAPRFAGFYQWLLPKLIPQVQSVVCVSEFTRSRVLKRWPAVAPRTTVVTPGVSGQLSSLTGVNLDQELRQFGLEAGSFVLSVASFEPRKNHARLLEAWSSIAPRFRIPLVLAGQTGRQHIFPGIDTREREWVRFLGRVPDAALPSLYGGARAFVFPSLYEGFGIPPLEAAACGTPVIASNHPALHEALGPAARYCDAWASSSIAEAMAEVLSSTNLQEELAGLGRERVRLFSWDRAASETWAVLEKAA